jgi:phytanoyl-CoA hydroxylase
MRLTNDQLAQFDRDGFLVHEGFLESAELDHLTDCYMATLARLEAEQQLENVQSGGDSDEDHHVYQIRTAHLQHPIFRMLINDSRLLDLVESLLGPDLRLVHYQGLYKPPHTGGAIDWHQDNHYFQVEGNRTVSVWLALDEATVDNGCMWYLRGQHDAAREHKQLWDIEQKKGFYFAIPGVDEAGQTPAPVPRGGLSIHHCQIPHKSGKNRTALPRRGLAMHFMDAKVSDPGMLKLLPADAAPMLRGGTWR